MRLVIEIPEEYRSIFEENRCEEKFDSLCTNEFGYVLRKAFENGTPLPKGHGDLIDRNVLLEERRIRLYYHLQNGDTAIPIIDIHHAKAVIPADKEADEE